MPKDTKLGEKPFDLPFCKSENRENPEKQQSPELAVFNRPLDTLGQLPLSAYYEEKVIRVKKNLLRRANSKYVTNLVVNPLVALCSPLQKSYELSLGCTGQLVETEGKITSKYCDMRWCLVCSRIRTAKLVHGYLPQIQAMPEKWFVTLSRPNVRASKLKAEFKHYTKTASLINRFLREKKKLKYSSLRKLECTYNEIRNDFHPHFHLIFDCELAARAFLGQWLERNPTALLDKGNDIRQADDNSVMELFKYFTKVVSKAKGSARNDYRIHISALDTMFQAMQGMRTFQPCGIIKSVSEEVAPTESLESGRADENTWSWNGQDWQTWLDREFLDQTTGELLIVATAVPLTGYVPLPAISAIAHHIVIPKPVGMVDFKPLSPDMHFCTRFDASFSTIPVRFVPSQLAFF